MTHGTSHDLSSSRSRVVFLHGFLSSAEVVSKFFLNERSIRVTKASVKDFDSAYDHVTERLVLVPCRGKETHGVILEGASSLTINRISEVYRGESCELNSQLDDGRRKRVLCFNVIDHVQKIDLGVGPSEKLAIDILERYLFDNPTCAPYSRDRRWKGAMLHCLQRVMRKEEKSTGESLSLPEQAIEIEPIFRGYLSVDDLKMRVEGLGLPEREVRRSVASWGDMVFVLPYDPASRRVLLIKQFRPGKFMRENGPALCVGPIGGRRDREEAIAETVKREALEEAGLEIQRLHGLPGYYTSPGLSTEHVFGFIGEANLAGAGGTYGLKWEGEETNAFAVSLNEAMQLVANGDVETSHGLISLLYLAHHEE
ncbi:NUDIX domain-containing protein [Rhodovulum sulfidophilum]|uniref:NUDIX domain-containing protein n=1 Tax=Rhodovulum sulfidophilum TaxID=35806 RepID=UPI00192110B4|nr:NUDIX hydrolase [Rhodovulum sulfidophilum]MBL3561600.1 NUDIX hydrolase [Rhodovulum sulfidophilum]